MDARKQRAGRKGGRATVARHGREHMSRIGKKGAESLWKQYSLQPFELSEYCLVRKSDNKVVAVW